MERNMVLAVIFSAAAVRKFGGFSKPILERCIPIKIDGVSRREAMANDDMQTMKNILKI